MNQQPDKLFRDKLADLQKPAPASAWDRIAAARDNKKSGAAWWRVAASLLLLAAAGSIWILLSHDDSSTGALTENTRGTEGLASDAPRSPQNAEVPPSAQNADVGEEAVNDVPKETVHTERTPATAQNSDVASASPVTPPAAHAALVIQKDKATASLRNGMDTRNDIGARNDMATRKDIATRDAVIPPDATSGAPLTVSRGQAEKEVALAGSVAEVPVSSVEETAVTWVYSAEDVSAYLEKNSLDEATVNDKKQSSLKKLLQKANDLKTNQDPFGELRQRKNEILALNFKNDKREQKMRN